MGFGRLPCWPSSRSTSGSRPVGQGRLHRSRTSSLVVSGYLITQILLPATTKPRFLVSFYQRRVVGEILPALVVVLVGRFLAGVLLLQPSQLAALAKAHVRRQSSSPRTSLLEASRLFPSAASVTKPSCTSGASDRRAVLSLLAALALVRAPESHVPHVGSRRDGLLSFAYSVGRQ